MGIFSEYQPVYAVSGIPTFPVVGKRPAVKGFAQMGCKASEQLAFRFPEMDALAFVAGARSKITVLDIDSPDEDLLQDMMKCHGQTPIVVRSGSGNFQAWYRFHGEKRKIRPYGASIPVDLLGGGVVVAPPSKGSKGEYQFVRGSLDDLDRLKPANNVIEFPRPKLYRSDLMQTVALDSPLAGLITEGRNKALFNHLMRLAHDCDDLDALLDEAFTFANNLTDRTVRHAFPDTEIAKTANSVWQITQRGDNRFRGEPHTITPNRVRDQLHKLGPDAMYLHSILKAWNGNKEEFLCANGMANAMPSGKWARKRFSQARLALLEAGLIKEVSEPYTGHAGRFSWG